MFIFIIVSSFDSSISKFAYQINYFEFKIKNNNYEKYCFDFKRL